MANDNYVTSPYWRTLDVAIGTGVDATSVLLTIAGDEALSNIFADANFTQSEINALISPDGGSTFGYLISAVGTRFSLTGAALQPSTAELTSNFVNNPGLHLFKLVVPTNQANPSVLTLKIIKRPRLT